MTEPTFTKEQLGKISERWSASDYSHATAVYWLQGLAAFALALLERAEKAEKELSEASADATVLAHAYESDSRPPPAVVNRSLERGRKALAVRRARERAE